MFVDSFDIILLSEFLFKILLSSADDSSSRYFSLLKMIRIEVSLFFRRFTF